MAEVGVIVFLAAAAAFWWSLATRHKKHQAARAASRRARSRYHCVEVLPGTPSCEAVNTFGLVRFLSDAAPSLPVPGCRVARCTCRYLHYDDRRDEDDRRNPFGSWANVPPMLAGERRNRTERRHSHEIRPLMTR